MQTYTVAGGTTTTSTSTSPSAYLANKPGELPGHLLYAELLFFMKKLKYGMFLIYATLLLFTTHVSVIHCFDLSS